jgi:hypothetical protein
VGGQEDHQHEPAAEKPDQGDDDFPKVNAVMSMEPQYMHWSKAAITWGREDHPPLMRSPGEYALVLDPIMRSDTHTCHFSRMLINGGSNINLLY